MSKLFAKPSMEGHKPRAGASDPSDTLSVLAADMGFEGTITAKGTVKIEGSVVGDVRSQGQVLVGTGGSIKGNVIAREAISHGEIHGSIEARDRVELQPGAAVHGDITTGRIVVHEGGQVNGRLHMTKAEAAAEPSPQIPRGRLRIAAPEAAAS